MIALGIDCATKCGWALVAQSGATERLLANGVLNLGGKTPSHNLIAGLALRCRDELPAPSVVAIELPWLGRNVNTTIRLARFCGQFEQAFGRAGADIELVGANQWHSKILGHFGGKTRASLKPAAVLWAQGLFGVRLSEDEADAAGIAVHALRKRAWATITAGRC